MSKRKYTLKRRAERQRQTRERIVDAAMELHEELGPAATTISALADRAGVQRLTVYRHFTNEEELLGACTTKWLSLHPPPELSTIGSNEPAQRTRDFLLALYRYYRDTEKMWSSAYRDLEIVPALAEPMTGFQSYLTAVSKALRAGWKAREPKRLRATLDHAVRFSTWRSLAERRLGDTAMADLVCAWARAAAV